MKWGERMKPILWAKDLQKRYVIHSKGKGPLGALRRQTRVVEALKGVSFSLESGELVGYIGPNGAGKSTTVKILSGILTPDGGQCQVMDRTPWKSRVAHVANIGVVFGQKTQLWWDLPVGDSLRLLRDIYRVPEARYKRMLDELVGRLDLERLMDVPVRQLSLGQRMRCELAGSLIHEPKLLFLDEPTIGLDAVTKLNVRDFIREINRDKGVTVILTTHDMDDIEALCSRVLLIGDGRLLLDGPLDALRQGQDERVLTAELERAADQTLGERLPLLDCQAQGHRVVLRFQQETLSAAQVIDYLNRNYGVKDVTVEHLPIEQVIARLYGRIRHGEVG